MIETGKFVGYYAKPSKSWLIVKKQYLELANQIFADAGVKITTTGKCYWVPLSEVRHLKKNMLARKLKIRYLKSKLS